jgi:hypothetical protein
MNIMGVGEAFGEMMGFVLILFMAECFAPTVGPGMGVWNLVGVGEANGTVKMVEPLFRLAPAHAP